MKSKYNILNYGSQMLTKVCRPVTFPLNQETQHQIQCLKRCYRNSYVTHQVKTLGLAAPQIGVDKRIFITSKIINNLANFELMRNNMRSFEIYINPRIIQYSDECEIIIETCLSFGNDQYEVLRAKTVQIEYYTYNGNIIRKLLKGINSIVCQHQFDHLNGITIGEKGKRVNRQQSRQQNEEMKINLQMQNDSKHSQKQNRKLSPCHRERIDFIFCQREYGFNDKTFKMSQYERCIYIHSQDFGFWGKIKSAFM